MWTAWEFTPVIGDPPLAVPLRVQCQHHCAAPCSEAAVSGDDTSSVKPCSWTLVAQVCTALPEVAAGMRCSLPRKWLPQYRAAIAQGRPALKS